MPPELMNFLKAQESERQMMLKKNKGMPMKV